MRPNDDKKRCGEVREMEHEVLGRPPERLLRWGYVVNGVILVLTVCALALGRLPENLHAPLVLSRGVRPEPLAGNVWVGKSDIGRIRPGQNVKVAFVVYPASEYGMADAQVKATSRVPQNGRYAVEVCFPNGFRTDLHHVLEVCEGMEGEAIIRLQEKSFVSRLLMNGQ